MFKSISTWLKLLVILAGVYLLSQVTPIYLPVIISVILAFILNPLVTFLSQRRLWPTRQLLGRSLAVFIAFIFSAIIAAIVMTFILVPFISEFNNLINNLPNLIKRFQKMTMVIQNQANFIALAGYLPNIADQTMSSIGSFSIDLAKKIVNSIFGLASSIIELVIVPVLTYYFLKDWQIIKESIVFLFSERTRAKARNIIEEMGSVVSGYIRGQFVVSFIVGFLVFCGMYGFGVEYPMVLGLLAGITEAIPIIGPIIGAVPAILLAYTVAPFLALKVAVFYFLVQQFENHIIVPNVMGQAIDLHPIIVILSLLIGGQLFGIAGMVLAVPVSAILKVLLKHLWITEER
jgi:predicted PurR-regulated permease PerM